VIAEAEPAVLYRVGLQEDPYRYRAGPPDVNVVRGRGLWMVFTLCPDATVHSSRHGTRVV
jgi:hypothetical protein